MTPELTDNERGMVVASLDGMAIRTWTYDRDGYSRHGQGTAMLRAREFVNGWLEREKHLIAIGDRGSRVTGAAV